MYFEKIKKGAVISAGIFTAVLSLEAMEPMRAFAAEPTVIAEAEQAVCETIPEIKLEKKTYWKDNKLHDCLTDESRKELAIWVSELEIDGERVFPNISPELLEGQWLKESRFFVEATNGENGTGECVGLSQSSCRWNIDFTKKWCYVVGEDPDLVNTKEDARRILLEYPEVNALVQASQLQKYYNQCPQAYKDNPEKYALAIYRWGNISDAQVEYDGTNTYCDEVLKNAFNLEDEYDRYRMSLLREEKRRPVLPTRTACEKYSVEDILV